MAIKSFQDKNPQLGQSVYIDDSAQVIGDVVLGDHVSIWPGVILRGDVHSIEIGEGTNIQDCSVLHGTHDGPYSPGGFAVTIGKGVTVGHRAIVHACMVGDFCLVGMGAIIMDGAIVGNHVIIGAGSLVPAGKKLESRYLYVGSPVKKLRPLREQEFAFLNYSAEHYQKLKNKYMEEK